jgi:hypothetical protein
VRIVASFDTGVRSHPSRVKGRKPDRLGHLAPAQILLTFQAAQIGSGNGQRAVIEKPGHFLDRLPSVPAEFGGAMSEDVKARGR